ncbi:Crp/Fnr family transcriptional regulator [Brevundimonas sp. A19_0]|uniref:Crp/Fnr family transcriptional regulator n=1 Tax=Brevundimonas sp. A19_0 TaxID=2821087 RepID=UPI001ADB48DE|nr:Crp/Fnr family transcriptional regulator [Brevundimonas sp. A19_0]MBO9501420.1 Crp/Fnr family transcriptional regulator [Brevundimonas sp. A19_0]
MTQSSDPLPENRFIANLPAEEAAALRPLLRRIEVTFDQTVVDEGAVITEVHFPIDAQFANLIRFPDGSAVETAVVGFEGVTGLAPFMADRPSSWEIVCRAAGTTWVASAASLRKLSLARPRLLERLLVLTDLYQAQAAQTAACNALHPIPDRIARWLLTAWDLSPHESLAFRQEELARLIGTRRSTISEAASELKRRKVIAYGRGAIRITDRAGLEAAACDCYHMLRPRMNALLGGAKGA